MYTDKEYLVQFSIINLISFNKGNNLSGKYLLDPFL